MKAEFFYADDGMVASTDPGWIHIVFDKLTVLNEQVVLRTIVRETVRMVFQPCRVSRVRSYEAYTRRMTG